MATQRWDETWYRLREWTSGQGPSERLAAQILIAEGYSGLDPSHPLGGKDGGRDALCTKEGERWVMAVYFPRGQQSFADVKAKFLGDASGARANQAQGIAFVTNQELRLAERSELVDIVPELKVDLYHLERVMALLDSPALAATRKQFLGIDFLETDTADQISKLRDEVVGVQRRIEGMQTGGDTYCYFMLYHFDLNLSIAQNIVVISKGEFPLYDLRIRVRDMDLSRDVLEQPWGELNAPAAFQTGRWPLRPDVYYRVFFHARNGSWNQDLILRRSEQTGCWLAATRVLGRNGRDVLFTHLDNDFETEFGSPVWHQ